MSMFAIGVSGLNAAQSALYTTSNNISNVYTPGYNRELVILGESPTGSGVRVNDVQRQFNTFVANQLNASTSASSALAAYQSQISQIDNLLADDEAGLAPLMQNFFSALGDLSSSPSDPAARQGVIGTAETLSAQMRAFDGYLQDMQKGVNGQISGEVEQINMLSEQIAKLNKEITLATARTGVAPNNLLNQRDNLVAEMSKHIDVQLVVQDGGSYNLNLAGGQPLVSGTINYQLEAMASPYDPQRTVVGYRDASNNIVALPETAIKGGTMGGLLSFRSEALDKAQNQLGQMAVSLVAGFNAQHEQGVDLNGNLGEAFFSLGSPQVYAHGKNAVNGAQASVVFGDVSKLTTADYTVTVTGVDGGEPTFQVVRKDSGQIVEATFENDTLSFGGVELTFEGGLVAGDRYEVQPVRRAAGGVETLINDPAKIAAGQLNDGSVSGAGDNRNALALQGLQNQKLVAGNATLNQAYASMVSDIGNKTNVVQANLQMQQGLTDQLRAVQQSESGVNLDEEAANLMRYQQFYQANARVIETATTMFDTILGLRT
ncbi:MULTISPECIES: flagellar hook-associated protein FlgK [Halomonadaceae]|uniref:flagellar hook-associated protein FlgK n=1 Tax=Halomonadaceae TaxID=28256 RepID=UPI00159B0690|nr:MULTISPECIES: flagellar hook-associated protein FlgK [Halomonas]QJQ94410.1 flagellar hook-associated protein FlgK [Halomonas sp. PA5]